MIPPGKYKVLGLMSGTSLDGVDLALCRFDVSPSKIDFKIEAAQTWLYPDFWSVILRRVHQGYAQDYARIHQEYGQFLGEISRNFLDSFGQKADFVSSHGHTIFHQPAKHFTSQIGEGAAMARNAQLPVVCDFRTTDVAHGGQGAPLVPAGDEALFGRYAYCLNLGGFANISFRSQGKRMAYDIVPVNYVLNYLASQKGLEFDADGLLANAGKPDEALLAILNSLEYFLQPPPKSLGREWAESKIFPLLQASGLTIEDQSATYCLHVAQQIAQSADGNAGDEILVTGGGAWHPGLISSIKALCNPQVVIPSREIVEFKEALIFAYLGLCRWFGVNNCLASVTGADRDTCGGAIYLP